MYKPLFAKKIKMSLYQLKNSLTATAYGGVNPTNSNPPPFTATKMDSDAEFRGQHTVPTPANPMKGGYGYHTHKNKFRSRARGRGQGHGKSKKWSASAFGITLAPGLKFSSSSGGRRRRGGRSSRRTRTRQSGMTLARGYAGGRSRRRRRRGGNTGAGFPTGYALPGGGSMNGALANPPIPVPLYGS